MRSAAEEAIERLDWWHVIEVAPGVATPGSWDLRPIVDLMPWPESLAGLRCLDVGTMDGFWAFELERRGAAGVVAIDPIDPKLQDSPAAERRADVSPSRRRGRTFGVAAELLGLGRSTATSACTTSTRANRRVRPRGDGLCHADAARSAPGARGRPRRLPA